ncbi:MAG: hypothetical protein WB443_02610 [Nitrososphaeraceae archaeon]
MRTNRQPEKEDIIKGRREAERRPSDCTILISATIRTTNKADHNKGSRQTRKNHNSSISRKCC